jgi:predicted HTH transcriptional regulator
LGVDRLGARSSQSEDSVLREIAAFLNTDGGTLLIGVRDDGQIVGIAPDLAYVNRNNEDGFEQKLRQLMETRFSATPHGSVQIGFEPSPEGVVCRVEVAPALGVTYFRNEVYVRDGNRTVALGGRELVEWTQRRR